MTTLCLRCGRRERYAKLVVCRPCIEQIVGHPAPRPDDVSEFMRRVRDREVPTMVVGGVAVDGRAA